MNSRPPHHRPYGSVARRFRSPTYPSRNSEQRAASPFGTAAFCMASLSDSLRSPFGCLSASISASLRFCLVPIPISGSPGRVHRRGRVARSGHHSGSVLPETCLRVSQFRRASSSPPIRIIGNMTSADFSIITQRIAAHGAAAYAAACDRDLPR